LSARCCRQGVANANRGGFLITLLAELGGIILALGLLGRLASRFGQSPIPLYLLAGLAFGQGGLLPLSAGEEFTETGAEIGVILLLLTLGLEYTASELVTSLKTHYWAGAADFALNALPGAAAALLLGWGPVAAVALGGITWISSSGVIAKVLRDLGRVGDRQTPAILTVLVLEDLAMAVYLPILTALLAGVGLLAGSLTLAAALAAAAGVLFVALRSASPCPARWPRVPGSWSARCATCSPRCSSYSSA
jgi:CPA2 family monovalent cation:H+ antiporter-2